MPTTYDHLMADFRQAPRAIAYHLSVVHGIAPLHHTSIKRGHEHEVWHRQHEMGHRAGISGFQSYVPSNHTAD